MGFTPNPRFTAEVKAGERMGRFLQDVADEAASEVESQAPPIAKVMGHETSAVVLDGKDGKYAEVRFKSPTWHWGEFFYTRVRGSGKPYLRPGVLKAISRRGGRLGDQPKE
jgi:hypothetical protein